MAEKNPVTKTSDGTPVHQKGEIFIDPNQPGDIAHVVRDFSLQLPDNEHVIYWARCGVNGHSHETLGIRQKATFVEVSIDEALASLPESRRCPVCFDPDYKEPVEKAYDPKQDAFTGWQEW